jgi:hypothetical protein
MIQDYKDSRRIKQDQQINHIYVGTPNKFLHRPCKGTTKDGLVCAMPSGKDYYCKWHRPKK